MLETSQFLVFTLHLVYYILLHQQLTFKTDILGQYFTQYWSDLYYTAMFNSSVSTQCISLSLCTLLTNINIYMNTNVNLNEHFYEYLCLHLHEHLYEHLYEKIDIYFN